MSQLAIGLLLVAIGAVFALGSFVAVPYGERNLEWNIPEVLSAWREHIAWLGLGIFIYGLLELRRFLIISREKRSK